MLRRKLARNVRRLWTLTATHSLSDAVDARSQLRKVRARSVILRPLTNVVERRNLSANLTRVLYRAALS